MKTVIREYLASLRERGELDVILPDLLSQLGLNVFSRPTRGTRQDGVDVGAVGSLDGRPSKIYLFAIKSGDLTRKDWDGDSVQALRPSLNEILDAYIPNRIPTEHQEKDVVICVAIGGEIQEQVRAPVTGFTRQHTTQKISFEEWNGDRLASYIEANFLREELLPAGARSNLRKSLAMLDEPETSYQYFSALINSLSAETPDTAAQITTMRQISICVWILFAWARDKGNMEAAYLSSEVALLHAWNIFRRYADKETKAAEAMATAFLSVFAAYQRICDHFLISIIPHVGKLHTVSSAIQPSCALDVNLKLFDLLGRTAVSGIWTYWKALRCTTDETDLQRELLAMTAKHASWIISLIWNNPALLLPIKDDQATDIAIALFLLVLDKDNHADIRAWLAEIVDRAAFAHQIDGRYPCILRSYSDLLSHPQKGDAEYRKNVTTASVLYPVIALYSGIVNDLATYEKIARLKQDHLQHCNFQFWYADDTSEELLYINKDIHGATLSDLNVLGTKEEFMAQVFGECEQSPQFTALSAVRYGWSPLIIIACRHYRLPLPIHLLRGLEGLPQSSCPDGAVSKDQ